MILVELSEFLYYSQGRDDEKVLESNMSKISLFILCGIPFAGKTTLAKELARKFGWVRIDLDEVKFGLFGKGVDDEEINQPRWDKVYQEMYTRIRQNLQNGKVVVHDTGNFTKSERGAVREIAEKLNLNTANIYVKTKKEKAWKRLLKNKKSQERFQVSKENFEAAVGEIEPPEKSENVLIFNNSIPINDWIEKFIIERKPT